LSAHSCVRHRHAGTGAIGCGGLRGGPHHLFYISLLGHQEIAAAVGFAEVVGFSPVSAIGLTIGIGAVVARAIGATSADARRLATTSLT
jgi:hypothetical protein